MMRKKNLIIARIYTSRLATLWSLESMRMSEWKRHCDRQREVGRACERSKMTGCIGERRDEDVLARCARWIAHRSARQEMWGHRAARPHSFHASSTHQVLLFSSLFFSVGFSQCITGGAITTWDLTMWSAASRSVADAIYLTFWE